MADNKATEEKNGNFFASIGQFFKSVIAEIKKVVIPTKKQLINNTIIVLIACVILGSFIYVLDIGFGFVSRKVLGDRASDILATQQAGNNSDSVPLEIDEDGNGFTVDAEGNRIPIVDNGAVEEDPHAGHDHSVDDHSSDSEETSEPPVEDATNGDTTTQDDATNPEGSTE